MAAWPVKVSRFCPRQEDGQRNVPIGTDFGLPRLSDDLLIDYTFHWCRKITVRSVKTLCLSLSDEQSDIQNEIPGTSGA